MLSASNRLKIGRDAGATASEHRSRKDEIRSVDTLCSGSPGHRDAGSTAGHAVESSGDIALRQTYARLSAIFSAPRTALRDRSCSIERINRLITKYRT